MSQIALAYEQLLERFVAWAQDQPDIRAAVVVGSRARTDRPADDWSDLDIVVLTTDPQRYLADADWPKRIGQPWVTFLEGTSTGGERERRVLFEGGLDVDFALIPARKVRLGLWLLRAQNRFPLLRRLLPRSVKQGIADFASVTYRGMRVLLDKDGLVAHWSLVDAEAESPHLPTQGEFLNAVNDFWYHAVWTAKKFRRGELWVARSCCDDYMKRLLLQMIEWHTRSAHGPDYDTWHGGRFLEQWADPRAVAGLRAAFAHYDEADVVRALTATMDLFRWLAMETAGRLGYPYPADADERATEFVDSLFR